MTKKVTTHVTKGDRVVLITAKPATKAQRKSRAEIPWTPAPKTAWQKLKRAAVG